MSRFVPARLLVSLVSLAALTSVAGLLAQQHPMKPGRWEVTASMQMGTMSMPPMTNTQCVTADDLKKSGDDGMPAGWANGAGQQGSCKVSDYKLTGNTVTWKMACTGARPTTGEGTMTFSGDTYTGSMTMTMAQGTMVMNTTGKRLGDCTK